MACSILIAVGVEGLSSSFDAHAILKMHLVMRAGFVGSAGAFRASLPILLSEGVRQMAKWIEWTDEQRTAWAEWRATRPTVIQEMMDRFPYDELYRLKSSGHRVTLYSYSENGTLTVNVTGDFNFVTFDRRVFGIEPDDLEPCDLPNADEHLGTFISLGSEQ